MAKTKRKQIEELLFQVYDKGLQMEDCNLTDYYEKIMQALNIPLVSKLVKPKSKINVDDPNAAWNWKKIVVNFSCLLTAGIWQVAEHKR